MDMYTTNDECEEWREAILRFVSNPEECVEWVSGSDSEQSHHYIMMTFALYNKRGYVAIKVHVQNMRQEPYSMQSTFFIITEMNQLVDFGDNLERFIKSETYSIEGLMLLSP